jgi:lipopolysaccharide/colanic/teichoic acid biosynthesis glycosyltransferase
VEKYDEKSKIEFLRASVNRFYIVPDSLCDTLFDMEFAQLPVYLRERIYSLDIVIQKELEVLRINSDEYRHWWQLASELRESKMMCFKRCIDLFLVSIMILPAGLIVALAGIIVKMSDGGPIFYRQKRLGQYGSEFVIIKIRSMCVDSEKTGARWAGADDKRVTGIGRLLRLTRIDELPQLWNIARGDMSFVGPRPERPELYSIIVKELPEFYLRLACKPGLTGWAQVNYPYGASIHDAKMKLLYDLFYIDKFGFILEMRVITRTIVAMVRGAR